MKKIPIAEQTPRSKAATTSTIIIALLCIFVVSAATLTVALIPAIPAWLSAHAMWLTPLIQWGPWLPAVCTGTITTALCIGLCLCLHTRKNTVPIVVYDADKAAQPDAAALMQQQGQTDQKTLAPYCLQQHQKHATPNRP